jgi:glutathione S-transferase
VIRDPDALLVFEKSRLRESVEEAETTLRDPAAVILPYNPVGRVPTLLLEDRTTITETTLVLSWLDRSGGAPRMVPEDASGMAAYGLVLGLLDGIAVWNRELRRPMDERSRGVIALEETRADRVANALERDVAAGAYANLDAGFLALATVLGYGERRHTVWRWREASLTSAVSHGRVSVFKCLAWKVVRGAKVWAISDGS